MEVIEVKEGQEDQELLEEQVEQVAHLELEEPPMAAVSWASTRESSKISPIPLQQ